MPLIEFSPDDLPEAQDRAEIEATIDALRRAKGLRQSDRQFLDDSQETLDRTGLLTPARLTHLETLRDRLL